ncbi:alkaline phosphatase [Clostridium polynesiense]|uniref:alkaline phosphatase n=1 Tax=Clostridium polynesiense TaxID=1325933 RepID=UPI00058ABCD1|nr:alkaline phosphatase [Clostridium polynesiense]
MVKLEKSRKRLSLIALICAVLMIAGLMTFNSNIDVQAKNGRVKNVIMLIPDGTSIEAITIARWYNGGKPFAMDEIAVGLTRTHWRNGPITDSAPGGTAYAIGHKTDDKHVGVIEGGKPKATLIEAARLSGKSTGIVATSEVMHATPADFTAHDPDRGNYNSLMKQQIYNSLDVVLGGGNRFFTPEAGGKRADGKDLIETIKGLGYEYVTTKEGMKESNSSKLWGAFADKDLQYDIDRIAAKSEEPTLAEMSKKAIEILSKDKDGFFLMIEGSKIDWAAHDNDPAGMAGDIAAFDAAVKVALDFAKKDGNTVVVSSADHGTGGPIIGGINPKYSSVTFKDSIDRLKSAKISLEYANTLLKGADDNKVREIFKDFYGINDPTAEEIAMAKNEKINKVISNRANISWAYGGHNGGDVGLYNYAPIGSEKLGGVVDNTEVGRYMARVLGLDLDKTSERLFVNAKEAFEDAEITMDTSDKDNPILKVKKGKKTLELFGYSNVARIDGKEIKLEGVIVTNKTSKGYSVEDTYVPMQAVKLIK